MTRDIIKSGTDWAQAKSDSIPDIDNSCYCETRDVFQARLDSMRQLFIQQNVASEDLVYLLAALVGEIGNNSFDHNGGHWPDDVQALEVAFKEKLSGRAPENRGNGLKFVRQTVHDQKLHLSFYSGSAQAELNDAITIKPTPSKLQGCLAILTF